MPKVKSKRARSGDSDDEVGPSGTQSSQQSLTQAEKHIESMSREQIDFLVNELVTYLLISDQNKLPIKRQDINKNVLKDNSRAFASLIIRAKAKLETVFGIKLVELKQNLYILVNNITSSVPEDFVSDDHTRRGLLMVILSLIMLDGDQIDENQLLENLRKIGVDADQPHEVFGDVRQLINEYFVRRLYLECEKQNNTDPPKILYRWGARARSEITDQDVNDFMLSICSDEGP